MLALIFVISLTITAFSIFFDRIPQKLYDFMVSKFEKIRMSNKLTSI